MPSHRSSASPSAAIDASFNCVFWNCNYLYRSVDTLLGSILTHAATYPSSPLYHLFAFVETKRDDTRQLPSVPGYVWHERLHRANSGGLACLIHDSIGVRPVDASHPSLAALSHGMAIGMDADDSSAIWWLELHPPHQPTPMLLAVVYLRPSVPAAVLDQLTRCLDTATRLWPADRPMLLLGDFNLRHSELGDAAVGSPGCAVANSFVQYLDGADLTVLNRLLPAGTCTRPASRAMLDLAICNQTGLSWMADVSVGAPDLPLLSDHQCVVVRCLPPGVRWERPHPSGSEADEAPRIEWRLDALQSEEGQDAFRAALEQRLLSCFPYAALEAEADRPAAAGAAAPHRSLSQLIESAYDTLLQCIHDAARVSMGVRRTQQRSVAWWCKPGVQQAYDAMHRAHRAWRRASAADRDAQLQRFRHTRHEWQQVKAEAKRRAWVELCASLQPSVRAKVVWSVLRRTRPSSFTPLSSFPHPRTGALPSSLRQSLDHLTDAFVQSSCPPAPLPAAVQHETDRLLSGGADGTAHPSRIDDESDRWQFSIDDVQQQCERQHTNTAAGPDSVAAIMLRHGGPVLFRALSLLFNYSWRHGVLPQAWRSANVCALYKGKGARHVVGSFRPISVTSVVVRTLEHLIHRRLVERLETGGAFHPTQFGFRRDRSTQDALLYVQAHLRCYLRDKHQTIPAAFLDLRKAFDRVSPTRLLYLLSTRAGVNGRAWSWIAAFLSGRRIRAMHRGQCSDWHSITYGVPQGSVLSPLLFLIFVQEAIECLRSRLAIWPDRRVHAPVSVLDTVHVVLFADDIVVLPRFDAEHPLPRHVWLRLFQQALDGLTKWADHNQMEFSSDKSNVVWFTPSLSRSRADHWLQPPLHLGGFILPVADSYTYLGVQLHRTLTWKQQYERMLARAASDSFLISRLIRSDGPPYFPAIRALCMGYLRSRCTYALALWRPTDAQLTRLQATFLRPIRRLLCLPDSTNAHGVLIDSNCPSFHRYRQSVLHQLVVRIHQLPPSHPVRLIWPWEGRVSAADQIVAVDPVHLRSMGVELWHSLYRDGVWDKAELCEQPYVAARCKQYALQLTHADWQQVPHRDPTDPTVLRDLIPAPRRTRSLYLYREEHRDTTILRARLRHNRAGTAINTDRGTVTAGAGLCHVCSAAQQQAVRESVPHLLLECSRYASLRQRLLAQLRRVQRLGRPPPLPLPALSLSVRSILDSPPIGLIPRSAPAARARSMWATWLACTGQMLRRLSHARRSADLPAL